MDEELKYYEALQPLFDKAMGPWQVGDWFYYPPLKSSGYVILGDDGELRFQLEFTWFGKSIGNEFSLRLPLPVDPRNPERGLWGMCPGATTIGKQLFISDSYFVTYRETDKNGDYVRFISFKGETPTLALLKALAAQEEILL